MNTRNTDSSRASFIVLTQMLRALFYSELQKTFHCNLVLHPFKGMFVSDVPGIPRTVLNVFSKEVREARTNLMQRWFGDTKLKFHIPILTQFVLDKVQPGVGLMGAIKQVRESKEAVGFRKGIQELIEFIDEENAREIDRALSTLEFKSQEWAVKLGSDPRSGSKEVSLSLPFVGGLGTSVSVPIPKVKLSATDKVLTFVHSILSHDLTKLRNTRIQ